MDFAERLLNFRIDNRLSQAAVAEIIGADQATVSKYENGKREPSKLNKVYYERKLQEYERSVKQ